MQWLGEVPAHWTVARLRDVAAMRVSNVDKHTRQDEAPVRLCNYVDVYHNERITPAMPFMRSTASAGQIERYRLWPGDVLITKDSEICIYATGTGPGRAARSLRRQAYGKRASGPDLAGNADGAAVRLGDVLDDRQSQA